MREKELRLALICYGGVSLAVYMHGISKEIWHLNRASRAFHDGLATGDGSIAVYREMLEDISRSARLKLRIVTDIVSGASAGGINGVFLAQAIVTGQSLDPLTRLWLDCADVDVLLDPDARPVSRFSKFWAQPIAWAALRLNRTIARTVSPEARNEVADKITRFVRARWFAPPFGGPQFCNLLLDAVGAMESGPRGPKLLPAGQPLDLFVTVTDYYGYPEYLRLNSPREVIETEHRLTIGFSTRGKEDGALASNPSLSFAARATASFPGAFPPFRVDEMDGVLSARAMDWPDRASFLASILPNQHRLGIIEDTVLIDGSVLANAPFRQAIGAIRNRPARREVDRRFVYIEPKPGRPGFQLGQRPPDDGENDEAGRLPGFFSTLLSAISNIPREQPIRDNLEQIEVRSQRIRRMQIIGEHLRPEIEETVESLLGPTAFLLSPTPRRIAALRLKVQEKSARAAGFAYSAYAHLKLAAIGDDIVATFQRTNSCDDPVQYHHMRDALQNELLSRGLDRLSDDRHQLISRSAISFFRHHDLRYRVRRMRYLARRLAEDIENRDIATPDAIERLHDAIYDCLAMCLERETAEFLGPEIAEGSCKFPVDAAALLDMLAKRQALVALDESIDAILCDAINGLPPAGVRSMMLAYLGFPLYDIATLPLMEGEAQDEFDPIKVDRIAPDDATALRSGNAEATLKGIEFNNFGAFFCRAYRENDYLWGRLHGADRLVDIVNSTLGEQEKLSETRCRELKYKAFRAILDEEQPVLTEIADLIAELRAQVEKG